MDWDRALELAREFAEQHWIELLAGAGLFLVGAGWGWWRGRRQARRRRTDGKVNVSLTSLHDSTLRIRTLLEKPQSEMFAVPLITERIHDALGRTNGKTPLVPFSPDDRWYLLNTVLNEISERFAEGHLKRDMGEPVKSERYLLSLAYEVSGGERDDKLRALVIKKATLLSLPESDPPLESPQHAVRFQTLQKLASEYQRDPAQFLELEVCL